MSEVRKCLSTVEPKLPVPPVIISVAPDSEFIEFSFLFFIAKRGYKARNLKFRFPYFFCHLTGLCSNNSRSIRFDPICQKAEKQYSHDRNRQFGTITSVRKYSFAAHFNPWIVFLGLRGIFFASLPSRSLRFLYQQFLLAVFLQCRL